MKLLISYLLLIFISASSGLSMADDHDDALDMLQSGEILPLETILQMARKHQQGKVLEVELERKKGRVIYELEVLDESGRVWKMIMNAANGEVIKKEQE